MNNNILNRFLFFFSSSFIIAYSMYYFLFMIMPKHYVFGQLYRMFLYHCNYPLGYILICCFFYAIFASLLAHQFLLANRKKRILLTLIIIIFTILSSSPFGGMLWHFHDMRAGFFPDNWMSKMISNGFTEGLKIGWFVILLSIPYNIFGAIICYFLSIRGATLFK